MPAQIQHGYLVLADISGFTSYLAKTELDHAQAILTDLLETIVAEFKSVLTLSKLEGDAIFAYCPESKVTRGETLLELLENTYREFRAHVEVAHRRTTCECKACQAIPTLDLKFFVHHGDYIFQEVAGHKEVIGSDVNLAHRLMKNHVAEATGWKAYALFTQNSLTHLKAQPENLHPQVETYEHLGDVQTYSINLRSRYDTRQADRKVIVTEAEAHLVTTGDFPVPPAVLWDWLNEPKKRAMYAFESGYEFVPVNFVQGRTGVGAQTHCMHGKKVAMVETVLDWHPFEYYTVEQVFSPMSERATFTLTPLPDGGTRLTLAERGKFTSVAGLDRLIFKFMFTQVMPTARVFEHLAKCIAAEQAPSND